jgi:hypothetical protein
MYYIFMDTSIAVIQKNDKKKRGRPATGQEPVTAIRLGKDLLRLIDDWRRKEDDIPPRSEAIRRMIRIAAERKK